MNIDHFVRRRVTSPAGAKFTINQILIIMEQVIRNEWGEPIGTEYIPSAYEQEIAYCEEMDRRAEDPLYAAQVEEQRWYDEACAAFEERGIKVPDDVINALSRELQKNARERAKQAAYAEMQPYVDWLKANGYKAVPYYEPETPWECEYKYVEVSHKDGTRLSRKELDSLIDKFNKDPKCKDYYFEDYVVR